MEDSIESFNQRVSRSWKIQLEEAKQCLAEDPTLPQWTQAGDTEMPLWLSHWAPGGKNEMPKEKKSEKEKGFAKKGEGAYTRLIHKSNLISEKKKELASVKMELEEREDEAMASVMEDEVKMELDARKKMRAFDSFTEAKKKFEAFEAEAMELPDCQLVEKFLMHWKLLQEIQDEVFKTCQGFAAAFCGSTRMRIERFAYSLCARLQALKELLEARLKLAVEIGEAPVSAPQAPVSSYWTAAAPKKNSGASIS